MDPHTHTAIKFETLKPPNLLSTWYFLAIFTRFVPDNRFHIRKFCSDYLSPLKTCIFVIRQSFCGINQSIAVIFFLLKRVLKKVCTSVADPNPDPHVFGPPGSGSTS